MAGHAGMSWRGNTRKHRRILRYVYFSVNNFGGNILPSVCDSTADENPRRQRDASRQTQKTVVRPRRRYFNLIQSAQSATYENVGGVFLYF